MVSNMSSPNMTSQIPIVSFPLQRGHFWFVFVKLSEIVGFFVFWAPQVAQNLFLRVDSASWWYSWLFHKGFSAKEKLSKFRCIWPLNKNIIIIISIIIIRYDKPCGKLALGQNCIKIIRDKSNSVAMFLRIQTDIEIKCHVRATFSLKCRSK